MDEQGETLSAPHADETPPKGGVAPFAWISLVVVAGFAVAVLLIALAIGVAR